jgi:glycosidase
MRSRVSSRGRFATVCLVSLVVAVALPVGATAQDPSPGVPSVRPPLAVDGRIREGDLQHDSRDDTYRTPGGAVPAGTPVLLRVRAAAGDLSGVDVRVTDRATGASSAIPMQVVATDQAAGEHGHDWWQAEVTSAAPAVLDYSFAIRDGQSVRFLSDDPALDGGAGQLTREAPDTGGWQLTFHDPAFTSPDWTHGAVVYQIFPDRFANGDPTNDPSPDASPGPDGADRHRFGDVYGNPILPKAWDERPEGFCRAFQDVPCDEQPLGRDFFGGDLAGITAHLDELADLGVTAIYLNPIFAAPSNHRYDTSDYTVIDPDLGTLEDFQALVTGAKARGIRLILDGVFNHVSSDSPWFDRARRYAETGACESADSPTRDWFTFRKPGPGQPSPCAPTEPGGEDTYYQGWFNFDTIPEVAELPAFTDLIVGEDGVVRQWLGEGIGGWRLDVADSMSHAFIAQIRDAAKAADPDSVVIVEQWGDSTPWLLGDQGDSTMNYRFRRAVIGLVNGATNDLDGEIAGLTPSAFANAMESVQEDYPAAAFDALLNLVDSHDTTRILWTLTPGADNEAAKSDPAARAVGVQNLALVQALQLTFPGMASIYYGGEVGLSGHDDPDDRRPYPWDDQDLSIRASVRTLARARAEHEALRTGDLTFLVADDARGALAFLRRSPADAAITALNLAQADQELRIPVAGRLPEGAVLVDLADGTELTVTDGAVVVPVGARSARVLVAAPDQDLLAPDAPMDLAATAATGRVDLGWTPVDGAVTYQVWRSLLSGGGFTLAGETADPTFVDTAVRDGAAVHHVVTAVDAAGNASARSAEVVAMPQLDVTGVRLDASEPLTAVRSAIEPGPEVAVRATVTAAPRGVLQGLRAQVGVGPAGTDPAGDRRWIWTDAQGTTEDATSGTFRVGLPAVELGDQEVVARVSADGGASWILAGLGGTGPDGTPIDPATLSVTQGPDTTPPPVPGEPDDIDVADDHVTLTWAPVVADDLHGYRVLRGKDAGGPFKPIAEVTGTRYTDTSVGAGNTYRYAIVALDTSLNASEPGPAITVEAARRQVPVTFTVTVPAGTPPTDTLYIAGDFQGWNPGATPMTQVDPTTWTITIPFDDATPLQYKYTRGSWEAVEKDAGCGEIPNRTLVADHGAGDQQVADTVETWRDLDGCP